MITDFLQQFTDWFVAHGYWGVFLATLGVFPAELVIALVAAINPEKVITISLIACLGEALGGLPTYLIGYLFNEEKVYAWLNGKGKFLGIKQLDVEKSVNSILKKGFLYIFISRLIPGVRVAATIAAGFMEMKIIPVTVATILGTFVYAFPIALIGSNVGSNWEDIQTHLGLYNRWLIGVVLGYLLLSTLFKYRRSVISFIKSLILHKME